MASMGLNMDEQKAVEKFQKQVVDPSQTKLVIVDFWAEWCGPCKALTPVLEKVCAEYADKGVVLAKINVDEEKFIAEQFQVKSIPTVYAMFQGQPVADLTPARSESQLKGALDQIIGQLPLGEASEGAEGGEPAPDLEQLIEMAEQVLTEGDGERAAQMFMQIGQMDPSKPEVFAGLIRALIAAGHKDHAQSAYEGLPPEMKEEALVQKAYSALELVASDVDDSELQGLRTAAAQSPADMDAQMGLAEAAFAAGSREEAADVLLAMIEADPEWNEGAAKAKLLQIFEAVGLEDEWVSAQRRRLSILLFG